MRILQNTVNVAKDITSSTLVFNYTIGTANVLCDLLIRVGDGLDNLDASVDTNLTIKVTSSNYAIRGADQVEAVATGRDRLFIPVETFAAQAGSSIAVYIESDNPLDTAVAVKVTLFDGTPLQPTTQGRLVDVDANGEVTAENAIDAAALNSHYLAVTSYGDSNWATATGFATPANVSNTEAAIKSYGDLNWETAVGFATPTNVSNAEAAIKSYGDSNWATATGFATPANVDSAEAAILARGNLAWMTATGFATAGDQMTVDMAQATPGGSTVGAQLDAAEWTSTEKQQLRYRLGIDGSYSAPTTNTPNVAPTLAQITAAIDSAETAIIAQGNSAWVTATGFSTLTTGDIDARLVAYDAPTHTEMTAAFTEIKGAGWFTDTDTLEAIALSSGRFGVGEQQELSRIAAAYTAGGYLGSHTSEALSNWVASVMMVTPANKLVTDASGYVTASNMRGTDGANTVTPLSAAQINAEVDSALADYNAPTHAEMTAAFTEIKGSTWSSLTDTLEALRDRGDAAWTTAVGFATVGDQMTVDMSQATPGGSTVGAQLDAAGTGSGGTGTADWTSTEREQIRYRLGIDGTEAAPTVNTDTNVAPTLAQITAEIDAVEAAIKSYGDLNWTTATGFATPANVDSAEAAILAQGNSAWVTATGFAVPGNEMTIDMTQATPGASTVGAQLDAAGSATDWSSTERAQLRYRLGIDGAFSAPTTNTDTNVAPTLTQITSVVDAAEAAILAQGNSAWTTAAGFATSADVNSTEAAIKAYGDLNWTTATGFATPANVDSAEAAILAQGNSAWTTATGFAVPGSQMTVDMAQATPGGSTVGVQLDAAGTGSSSGGTADWTSTEKEQIRYRLGIDGVETVPATNSDTHVSLTSSEVEALLDTRFTEIKGAGWSSTTDTLEQLANSGGSLTVTQDANLTKIAAAYDGDGTLTATANAEVATTVDTELTSKHGSGAWSSTGLLGDWVVPIKVVDGSAKLVKGARAQLYSGGAPTAAVGFTSTDGTVTVSANDGTYDLRVVPPIGYELPADQTVTFAGADLAEITVTVTAVSGSVIQDLDVYRIFGRTNVRTWADMDGNDTAAEIDTRIDEAIAVQIEYFSSHISRSFDVTNMTDSVVVRDTIARMAGLDLYVSRGFEDDKGRGSSLIKAHQRKIDEVLQKINNHQLDFPGASKTRSHPNVVS